MRLPSYLELQRSGELARRADTLDERLANCDLCAWACGADRRKNRAKICRSRYLPVVSAAAAHFGEEPALSGTHLGPGEARGTGNIFFAHCNLRCVYCQNWQISQAPGAGREVGCDQLAAMILDLERQGCHTIGFVSPTHYAAQAVRAVEIAAARGLHTPLVYNTNAYDNLGTLRVLEGIFDIYLPDLRYSSEPAGREYSRAPDYPRRARAAIAEMFRQVGDELELDERGLVRRGLIIRLLILPNELAGLRDSLQWIRDALSARVTLSVMTQYYPAHRAAAGEFPLLDRPIRQSEYDKVLGWLDELGFENGWVQPLEAGASDYYRPDFRDPDMPFADARDYRTPG
jgi:putative pyruvate formate lyase activating enzyme